MLDDPWFHGVATVPMTIGVVGHRDLLPGDEDRLRCQIREVVKAYRDACNGTSLILMTSLAEGADWIAARVGISLDRVDVVAILPMPIDEYIKDFKDQASRQEFEELLAACSMVVCLDELASTDWLAETPQPLDFTSEGARAAAYQRGARFLSQQSHVLIAVWDGRPPEGVGGTADTVHARLQDAKAFPISFDPARLWPDEQGIQIQIPATRRQHGEPPLSVAGDTAPLRPLEIIQGPLSRPWAMGSQDLYLRELIDFNASLAKYAATHKAQMDSLTSLILDFSDLEANRFRKLFQRLAAATLSLGVLALVIVGLYQDMLFRWAIGGALITIVVMGMLWWWLLRSRAKDEFQFFRTLAEGMRVQQVWLRNWVRASTADNYLLGQPEAFWIRRLIRSVWFLDSLRVIAFERSSQGLKGQQKSKFEDGNTSAAAWMEGQISYFLGMHGQPGALARNEAKARSFAKLTFSAIIVAMFGLGLMVLQSLFGIAMNSSLVVLSQVLWDTGLAVAAALTAYSELMAFREMSRQYSASIEVFRNGLQKLLQVERTGVNPDRRQLLIKQVGEEALRETASWLSLHYDRSVRPVA